VQWDRKECQVKRAKLDCQDHRVLVGRAVTSDRSAQSALQGRREKRAKPGHLDRRARRENGAKQD